MEGHRSGQVLVDLGLFSGKDSWVGCCSEDIETLISNLKYHLLYNYYLSICRCYLNNMADSADWLKYSKEANQEDEEDNKNIHDDLDDLIKNDQDENKQEKKKKKKKKKKNKKDNTEETAN